MLKNSTVCLVILVAVLAISCGQNKPGKPNATTGNPDSLDGKKAYTNPVDGKTYTTDKGFESYTPDGGIKPVVGKVKTLNIVLLTEQDKLEKIIGVEKLAGFINSMDTIVANQFADSKTKGEILIQYTLYSDGRPAVHISFNGDIDTSLLQKAYDRINNASSKMRTLEDSCVFQCHYGVNVK